jgi:D-alanyl-D-alanine carboxypeptidase (penicillin-binding protein 5/6)
MRWLLAFLLTVSLILSTIGYWLYKQPLPAVHAKVEVLQPAVGKALKLPWPAYGQAALGEVNFGVLDSVNTSKPVPIASIAKVITALAILKEKPLEPNQDGPLITLSADDEKLYKDYLAKDGTVIPVRAGQQISQYHALIAMMLPSANNIADSAARWAFGSLDNYTAYANRMVRSLGMSQTYVADASGFSPKTVSTAKDLVILAKTALKNPLLAQIVGQSEANLPEIGLIKNINWLLGTEGIIGIKTGNTDEAGGCFLFAANHLVEGQKITLVGAILGAPTRNLAMSDSRALLQAADRGFATVQVVRKNQLIANYSLPWGGNIEAVATNDIKALVWKGLSPKIDIKLSDLIAPKLKGANMGTISVGGGEAAQSAQVVLKQTAAAPSWKWRILR